MLGVLLPLLAIAAAGALVAWLLARLHAETPPPWLAALGSRWSFDPAELAGPPLVRLALVSVAGLFLEMAMIRWISSEIRIFAYFKNFVLIACFLGFGVGASLGKRRGNLLALLVPLVLLALFVELPRELVSTLPVLLGATSEVQVWGVPSVPRDANALAALAVGVAVSSAAFGLIAFAFVPIGQVVGHDIETASSGVRAYTVNILGSLAGLLGYTLLCFAYQPPAIWFGAVAVLLVLLLRRQALLAASTLVVFAAVMALAATGAQKEGVRWSPYQKLKLSPNVENGEVISYALETNDSWYQHVVDLSPGFVARHAKDFVRVPIELNAYNIPYRFCPGPRSVLILGAGMGNDVAAALRNGATNVVAVEIDPLIQELGKKHHFEKPYDSPAVRVVIDDARSYLERGDEKFDLICFSLLDSHTTSSHYSNVRIDNYVYTLEAMTAARRHLAPDGIMIIKFEAATPWIAGRLQSLLEEAFGFTPLQVQSESDTIARFATRGRFYVVGQKERIARTVLADPLLLEWCKRRAAGATEPARATTDDWPYFYQRAPGVPLSVLVLSATLVVFTTVFVRAVRGRGSAAGSSWSLFFLGAAFMLLETQIVSRMALLFGTTWLVNTIVVGALLAFIVASNGVGALWPKLPLAAAYALLFASILVSYFVPLRVFFFESPWLKAAAASAVLGLPVFFAGLVFIRTFAEAGYKGEALGSNLLGALAGGVLESISFWTGLRALLLIALALYALAAVAHRLRPATAVSAAPTAP